MAFVKSVVGRKEGRSVTLDCCGGDIAAEVTLLMRGV